MKDNLGSEVLLRVEALSEDNSATTDSLRALDCNWSTSQWLPIALRRIQTWGSARTTAYPTTVGYGANEGNV